MTVPAVDDRERTAGRVVDTHRISARRRGGRSLPGPVALEADSSAPFTDDELAALALAADPDLPLGEDAVSLWDLTGDGPVNRLPEWYMPAPMGGRLLGGWRRRVVLLVIISFLTIDAYGLCNTYGWVHFG